MDLIAKLELALEFGRLAQVAAGTNAARRLRWAWVMAIRPALAGGQSRRGRAVGVLSGLAG